MKIARVIGSAVSTAKADTLSGSHLLLVQETTVDGETLLERPFVALDAVGAGTGELVLVVIGSAARVGVDGAEGRPTDALIVGILDSLNVGGADVFRKS